MATPALDSGLLNFFSPLFLFLLIFAVIYAMLQWSKLFGDNKTMHAIIAIVIGLFGSLLSQSARSMIEYIIPWFTFLIIFGVMIIVMFKMFGVSDSSLTEAVKTPGVMWTIIIVAIVIALGALSNTFGQSSLDYTSDEESGEVATEAESGALPSGEQASDAGGEVGIISPGNPGTSDASSQNFKQNLGATFYHPRVLGALFILLIAAVGVRMLTAPIVPP